MFSSFLESSDGLDEDTNTGVELFFFPDEAKQGKNRHVSISSDDNVPYKNDAIKRRFASDDSISVDDALSVQGSSYIEPSFLLRPYDTESLNTEMRELLDFETSVMGSLKPDPDNELLDTLPQVKSDLGDVTKAGIEAGGPSNIDKKLSSADAHSDTDDDFCIISTEERVSQNFTFKSLWFFMNWFCTFSHRIHLMMKHFQMIPFELLTITSTLQLESLIY